MSNEMNNWHFARPILAKSYLSIFKLGLTSARGLFARRRMGKTEFLKKDFIPAANAQSYITVYVNLWDLESDPATAIISELYKAIEPKGFNKIWSSLKSPITKVKASSKIPIFGDASIEADLTNNNRVIGTLLMEAMTSFDKTKIQLMLIIDEAQVLAYEENSHFAHALRAALDIRKDRIKVIFAGSSETTLRRMFGVSSEPFYNWAPLEPFELLGEEFVAAMVKRVNDISKYPLSLTNALEAFSQLKNTPEFFRRYIEQYINNPQEGSMNALQVTKSKVFSDESFKRQWEGLLAADRIILSMIANGTSDLHGKLTMQRLGKELGIGDSVNKNTIHNALRRLSNKNILTKIEYGIYQFEDEAFADWVKHKE
jgi:hypothetical protein